MGDERVKAEAMQVIGMFSVLPRLVVFDLDYTLWPFYWMGDLLGSDRFDGLGNAISIGQNRAASGQSGQCLVDSQKSLCHYINCRVNAVPSREMPSLYPHAKGILHALKEKGIVIAIASRSPTPDIATAFLEKLSLKSMFAAQEIYSSWSHKTEHFQRIHSRTGVPFNSMLFFDDEDRNIQAVSKMGATSILVGNGVNLGEFRKGLAKFLESTQVTERNTR